MNYMVDYGMGIIHDTETDDLEKALQYADNHAAYSQRHYSLTLDGEAVAWRAWYGGTDGFEDEEDPIGFGNFGYYCDWVFE